MSTTDPKRGDLAPNTIRADGTTLPSCSNLALVSRNYNKTLIAIGGHDFPRESLLRAFHEMLILMGSLLVATLVRFPHVAASYAFLSDRHNWYRFALVTAVCQLAFYYNDLYDLRRTSRSRSMLLIRLVRALGVSFLGLAISYYLFPEIRLERGIVALTVPLVLISTLAYRLALMFDSSVTRPAERLLMVGTGAVAANLAHEILSRPELQYKIVGFLGATDDVNEKPLPFPGIIGSVSELGQIIQREQVDRVILCLSERRGVLPFATLAALKLQGLPIEEAQSIFARLTGRIMLEELRPSWLIVSQGFSKSQLLLAGKRVSDIIVSLLLIAITLPLMFAIGLAILLEGGGQVLFRQERLGLGGRPFNILKFRSMRQGSEAKPSWTVDGDPRITRLGRFLRKSRLDELPQLINILRGEMSLVGPRPEVPYFCELLEKQIPFFNQRHAMRPGLTGWAQVKYQYGASLEEAKIKFEFDLFYIQNLSLLLDAAIIFETVRVVIWGRGAK